MARENTSFAGILFPIDTKIALEQLATQERRSLSSTVVFIVQDWLKHNTKEEFVNDHQD